MGHAMSSPPPVSPLLAASKLTDAQALLDRLLVEHKPGFALQREFHTDAGIYQLDLERIWRRGWLFAGHSCEVKRPGDYIVVDIDTDSIIVMRGDEQDWDLCEKNQAGVNSSAFTPGPYSTKREYNVIRYIEWYLRQISRGGAS
jgi:phenylpropionate dioxygenase-like ring-hydroxylating dioxygenase large terminal subunit